MANIQGTNLAAAIAPFTTDDTYATHDSQYGKGGWHEVLTIAERDAIPEDRKRNGMAVFVVEEKKVYTLESDGSWTEFKTGPEGPIVSSVNGDTGDVIVKAVQNQKDNSTMIKSWVGTQEEYNAISEKDPNTLYFIKKDGQTVDIYELIEGKQNKLVAGNGITISGDSVISSSNYRGNIAENTVYYPGDSVFLVPPIVTVGSELYYKLALFIKEVSFNNNVSELIYGKYNDTNNCIIINQPPSFIKLNETYGNVDHPILIQGAGDSNGAYQIGFNKEKDTVATINADTGLMKVPGGIEGYYKSSEIDEKIPENITTQGNEFNTAGKLVQLDENGKLPPIDGSQLTGIMGSLPIASDSVLGGIKVGSGLSITEDGTLSAAGGTDIDIATSDKAGIVKSSTDNLKIAVAQDGTMSVNGLETSLNGKLTADKLIAGANITLTKSDQTGTVTIASIGGGSSVDMTNYYTKSESDNKFGSKAAEHTHANKTSILDLFTLDNGVLKWNGNVVPVNPGQIEKAVTGAQSGQVFDIAAICTEENIKALVNGYLFVNNTLAATPDLEEGVEDPNTATVQIYNGTVLMDTIKIAPSENRTYQLPNLKGIKVSINGTVDATLSLVGYIY